MSDEDVQRRFTIDLTDNQKFIQETTRNFAEQEIKPHVMEYDESQKFPIETHHIP